MAEERYLATARATDSSSDEDTTKAELQRRMEEARESITQTVTEIKDTVANQYQNVRDTVTDALDWREQFRKRPVAFSAGALSVGFVVGYGIAGALKGGGSDGYDYDDGDHGPVASHAIHSPAAPRAYATAADAVAKGETASYSLGYAEASKKTEPDGPGLFERLKGTAAFERLETEVGSLGDRFVDELSKAAQEIVLPALMVKIKDLFGVDLSNKQKAQNPGAAQSL